MITIASMVFTLVRACPIAAPSAEQTTVTLYAEGVYDIQLEAPDGEHTSTDIMSITVHLAHWAIIE